VNKGFTKRINGVTRDESDLLLLYLINLVTQNHDAQVRFKWRKNDLAIWDNRSTWHCATYDYDAARAGDRVCSLGEAPYLDLKSSGRREALETHWVSGFRISEASVNKFSCDCSEFILKLLNSNLIAQSSVQAFTSHPSDMVEIGIVIYNQWDWVSSYRDFF
jgi:hypothetical protein